MIMVVICDCGLATGVIDPSLSFCIEECLSISILSSAVVYTLDNERKSANSNCYKLCHPSVMVVSQYSSTSSSLLLHLMYQIFVHPLIGLAS